MLAGGLGTRLRPAVSDRPKPMADVRGRPFLEHLMAYWIGEGVSRFVLCVGHMSERVTEHFGNRFMGAAIRYSAETASLGTGGALALGLRRFQEEGPFLVLNGDTFFNVPLVRLEQKMRECSATWVTSLFSSPKTERYGQVILDGTGAVVRSPQLFSGERAIPGDFWVNGGVWLADPSRSGLRISAMSPPFSLETYLERFQEIQTGSFFGLRGSDTFIDIGVPEDYARAQHMDVFEGGISGS